MVAIVRRLTALSTLIFLPLAANADPIRFVPEGVADLSGYIEFDDSAFNGTDFQAVQNTFITDLFLNVAGFIFTIDDVVTTDQTFIDSTGDTPRIVNGSGLLAQIGENLIAFFPTQGDGDASLGGQIPGRGYFEDPRWVVVQAPEPAPLALILAGIVGIFLRRRSLNSG